MVPWLDGIHIGGTHDLLQTSQFAPVFIFAKRAAADTRARHVTSAFMVDMGGLTRIDLPAEPEPTI